MWAHHHCPCPCCSQASLQQMQELPVLGLLWLIVGIVLRAPPVPWSDCFGSLPMHKMRDNWMRVGSQWTLEQWGCCNSSILTSERNLGLFNVLLVCLRTGQASCFTVFPKDTISEIEDLFLSNYFSLKMQEVIYLLNCYILFRMKGISKHLGFQQILSSVHWEVFL